MKELLNVSEEYGNVISLHQTGHIVLSPAFFLSNWGIILRQVGWHQSLVPIIFTTFVTVFPLHVSAYPPLHVYISI